MIHKTNVTGIILFIAFLFSTTSCEKDSDVLLTDGMWTFENITTNSENETVQSLTAFAKALLTDATLTFIEDGSYVINSPLTNNPLTGSWSLSGDDTLVMNPTDENASTNTIDVLTNRRLQYSESFTDAENNTYKTTTTWVR